MVLNENQAAAMFYMMWTLEDENGVSNFEGFAVIKLTDKEIRQYLIEVAKKYPSKLLMEYDFLLETLKVCKYGDVEEIRTLQDLTIHAFMFYSMMYQLIDLDFCQWSLEHETFVNKNGISLN